jgi:1-acyl-sn-glycerol-3-phosphate acyltransferase
MNNYYPGNEYHTQPGTSRALGDYLMLGTRWYFYFNIFGVVWRARQMAVQGDFDDENWVDISFQMLQVHERCGAMCHFTGLDNISAHDGPVVFVGNHMSTAETFLMPSIIVPRKKTTFVVKKGLMDYPVFGPVMRSRNPIAVGRKDPREDFKAVMKEGGKRLEDGISVVIFPQSTRMPRFNPEKFNTIGIKLAKKANVPIVPFALKTDFWGNGAILKDAGPISRKKHIYIEFSQPMSITGTGKEEHAKIIEFIQKRLKQWDI